jgi:hypothetical protein
MATKPLASTTTNPVSKYPCKGLFWDIGEDQGILPLVGGLYNRGVMPWGLQNLYYSCDVMHTCPS